MPDSRKQRLAYIDWMRGFACIVMFQTHCYDSWLSPGARKGRFFEWSQEIGTLGAPLFLFLAGVAFALLTDRMRHKGVAAGEIARKTIRRGAEIFALGLAFRLQEYLLGWGYSTWTDLFRVDILNTIGISLMLMGVACWFVSKRSTSAALATAVMIAITLVTPLLWTTWRPRWLPWYLESYVNGVHVYDVPQAWLFPVFPWAAFAFAGLAIGFLLVGDWATRNLAKATALCGTGGVALFALSIWFDSLPMHLYPVYDYWHTSPNFFFARVGVMMMIVWLSYAWCKWGAGQWGFSPLIQLGQTSLLVYWLHIEFVYGRLSILPKRQQPIPMATLGLAAIIFAMVLVSLARTRWKGHGAELQARLRREPKAATAD
jgi:acyltransferase